MHGLVDVSAEPFRAMTDGSADCRVAVRDAVAYARSANAAGIFFPAGDFRFSRGESPGEVGSIDLVGLSDFVVAGAGSRSRLFHDVPSARDWQLIRIFNHTQRVLVRDLTLDGGYLGAQAQPGVSEQHHLIKIGEGSRNSSPTRQVRITGCYLSNCRGDAINIVGAANSVGVLTLRAIPAHGETVSINETTYRFVTALEQAFDVLIADSVKLSLNNLRDAILHADPDTLEGVSYGSSTVAHAAIGSASRDTNTTLVIRPNTPRMLTLDSTLARGSWDGTSTRPIDALSDEIVIDHNFISGTHRSSIGIQRGCRKLVINSNIIVAAQRNGIHFEPTGSNVNSEHWEEGNSPQQVIITENIVISRSPQNAVMTLSGTGARDRDKYSIVAHNLCFGGGIQAINVGPLLIDANIIIGSSDVESDPLGLIRLERGCQDVVISGNYIERPDASTVNKPGTPGPLIEISANNGVQPERVSIVNNIGRQHAPSHGVKLTSVNQATVRGNQLHYFHSALAGNGITHRSDLDTDHLVIDCNQLSTHGIGRWVNGIQIAAAENLGVSQVTNNMIDSAVTGIRYSGTPKSIPLVIANTITGSSDTGIVLPNPTCIGGNLGGVATYTGPTEPHFTAAAGSTYICTDAHSETNATIRPQIYILLGNGAAWTALATVDGGNK